MSQFISLGIWKHSEAPSGLNFARQTSFARYEDCPVCKYGTLVPDKEGGKFCIDCAAKARKLAKEAGK